MLELYKNIKNERIKKGWNQTELAKRIGYSDKSMIAKIEAGKVDLPQTKIRAFAEAFGCTESYLMGWNEESKISGTIIPIYPADNTVVLNDKEKEAFDSFRKLSPAHQRQLVEMLAFFKSKEDNQ